MHINLPTLKFNALLPCALYSKAALTQGMGKLPVDNDVSISADGRSEVCVEGHVEGIVDKLPLLLQTTSAEVPGQLKGVTRIDSR